MLKVVLIGYNNKNYEWNNPHWMRHSSKIAMFNVLCLLEVCYSLLENILLVKFKIEFIKLQFRMGCFSSWKFGKLQDLMHLSYGGFTVHTSNRRGFWHSVQCNISDWGYLLLFDFLFVFFCFWNELNINIYFFYNLNKSNLETSLVTIFFLSILHDFYRFILALFMEVHVWFLSAK